MYQFFHDPSSKAVYRCNARPKVIERKHRGKLVGWKLSLKIDIARADNWRDSSNRWHFATSDSPDQEFVDSPYSLEEAVSFFLSRNFPPNSNTNTVEIDEATYFTLKAVYEALASENAPED